MINAGRTIINFLFEVRSAFLGSFRAIPGDLRSLNRPKVAFLGLFGVTLVTFNIIDFNHLLNPLFVPALFKWENDRDVFGREPWQLALMTLSGISSFSGAITVFMAAEGRFSTWSWGLINTLCYGAFAFAYGYAGDAQLYYFFFLPTQIIGMMAWNKRLDDKGSAIRRDSIGFLGWIVLVGLIGAVFTFFFFEIPIFSKAILGYYIFEGPEGQITAPRVLDGLSNAFNVAAQLLMIMRRWEQWLCWITVNCIQISMFAGVAGFGIDFNILCMFSFFLINSLYGLYSWFSKVWKQNHKDFRLGICVGKFYPPHKGHEYLVNTGVSKSERLVVIVCVKPEEAPNRERAQWLQENCPGAEVHVFDENKDLDPNDSDLWAKIAKSFLNEDTPDVCFTSESYGASFAKALGPEVRDFRLDQLRKTVPISGTEVRKNPFRAWKYLSPNVRRYYSHLVVLVGAESTGKTVLCKNLAKAFKGYSPLVVEEHGRTVTNRKKSPRDGWSAEDFIEICQTQTSSIEDAMGQSFLVFADTDARATCVWQRHLMGEVTPVIEDLSQKARVPWVYLFCPVEGSLFVQDGTRKDGDHRVAMENELRDRCVASGARIVYLPSQDWDVRTDTAIRELTSILETELNPV